MNIKNNIRIAAVTAIACAGLSAGISTPAMAYSPVMTLSSHVKPTVRMTWKECYTMSYAAARDRGQSIESATNEADLTCGKTQDEY